MQQAKVVVLGEPRTGKSSLIGCLTGGAAGPHTFAEQEDAPEAFVTAEIPSHELDNLDPGDTVCLRYWECTDHKEHDVAFPGALFVIIVFDIRAPETANAAFNRWLAIKETHMTESFLFVVGTFQDMNVHRRVEIDDICKACAQKDAVYVEVSNTTGNNMALLNNLLVQRVNYMLKVRKDLKSGIKFDISNGAEGAAASADGRSPKRPKQTPKLLQTPFLEDDIEADSIGSILASVTGIEYWPGYEAERSNLSRIGKSLTNIVNKLDSCDVSSSDIDAITMEQIVELMKQHDEECAALPANPPQAQEPDFEELRHAYEIMGLTLPQALLGEEQLLSSMAPTVGGGAQNGLQSPSGSVAPAVKIRVKLPDGSHAALRLTADVDIGTQVAQFLDENGMHTDTHAFEKLVNAGAKALEEQANKAAGNVPEKRPKAFVQREADNGNENEDDVFQGNAAHDHEQRCIVRVKLPNGQVIETTVGQTEDAEVVASRIAEEYSLSMGYKNKVWEQLRSAQLQQNMEPSPR